MEDFNLSEHFTFYEITDSNRHPELVPQNRVDAMGYLAQLKLLSSALEEIRAVLQVSIKISSGFRNQKLNKAASGSATSGHTKGLCADALPKMSIKEAFNTIISNKKACPLLRKVIYENIKGTEWLHIEVKTNSGQPTQFFTTTTGKTYTEIA